MLAAMALVLAAVVGAYIVYRKGLDAGTEVLKSMPAGPSLTIENLRHTASKEGRTQWTLEAARAKMTGDRQTATLEKVSVVFFMEDGGKARLTADRGSLNLRSDDLEVSGNVVVEQAKYRLTAETLEYRRRQRMVVAGGPVKVTGDAVSLNAETAAFDLKSGRLRFEGNVHGIFHQNFAL